MDRTPGRQRAQKRGAKVRREPLPPDEHPSRVPRPAKARLWIIRTALCVEPRDGRLHIFMPPVADDGRLSRSIAGIENRRHRNGHAGHHRGRNAAARSAPEQARRHARSRRHRGQHASEQDRGTNWSSAPKCFTRRRGRRGLARKNSCWTAATPAPAAAITSSSAAEAPPDSPVLRRPDLLRSLLAYWQNHPSLELAVQRTCSSARPARRRALTRRATIRFTNWKSRSRKWPGRSAVPAPPWLVDRLFRNLLIDASGNTHRAEFSH